MTVKYYSTLEEKEEIEEEYHSKGYRISHDDFIDENGKETDGNSGKLTIIDVSRETPDPDFAVLKSLTAKLNDDTLTFPELKQLLRLRNG